MASVFILGYHGGMTVENHKGNKKNDYKNIGVLSNPISIVAHQLKNPLAVLKNYLEVLGEGKVGDVNLKQKEYLSDSLETVMKMIELVREFLEVSKIEEKCFEVEKEMVDIENVIKDIVKNHSVWANANNSKIIFKIEENVSPVCTDSVKIRQVVENLISNAIKYKTKKAGIIEIKLERKSNSVLLTCKNNGVNISDKDRLKIFNKFYRSKDAVRIQPSGTGLGLYISRAIVEGSGGKIWFENNEGDGVTFFVSLPVAVHSLGIYKCN